MLLRTRTLRLRLLILILFPAALSIAQVEIVPFRASAGVSQISRLRDGSLIVSGSFSTFNNHSTRALARISANGAIDTSFRSPVSWNLTRAVEGPDRLIYVNGGYGTGAGASQTVWRVTPAGALDFTFFAAYTAQSSGGPGTLGTVRDLAVAGDGSVIVGGLLSGINGPSFLWNIVGYMAFRNDGQPYLSFSSDRHFATINIDSFLLHSDGRLWATADYNGFGPRELFRALATGQIDPTFVALSLGAGRPRLAEQANGKVLIAGNFTTFAGEPRTGLARLHNNGALDTSFDAGNAPTTGIAALKPMSDGTIWIGGTFTAFNGQPVARLISLNESGSIHAGAPSLRVINAAGGGSVTALEELSDGSLAIGGVFTQINDTPTTNFAIIRLAAPAQPVLFMRDHVRLFRESDTLARITVIRLGGTSTDASVRFSVTASAAMSSRLPSPLNGTVAFPAGSLQPQSIDLTLPASNGDWQTDSAFTVTLSDATGARLLENRSSTFATVHDDQCGLDGQLYNLTAAGTYINRREAVFAAREIDFLWDTSPAGLSLSKDFGIAWRGSIVPELTGDYTFYAAADDAVWLSVGGQQVIARTVLISGESTGTIALEAGQSYPFEMLFQDTGGGAGVRLAWSSSLVSKETVPARVFRKLSQPLLPPDFRFTQEPGSVNYAVQGLPASAHILQRSVDLATWTPVRLFFTDSSGISSSSFSTTTPGPVFYRILSP